MEYKVKLKELEELRKVTLYGKLELLINAGLEFNATKTNDIEYLYIEQLDSNVHKACFQSIKENKKDHSEENKNKILAAAGHELNNLAFSIYGIERGNFKNMTDCEFREHLLKNCLTAAERIKELKMELFESDIERLELKEELEDLRPTLEVLRQEYKQRLDSKNKKIEELENKINLMQDNSKEVGELRKEIVSYKSTNANLKQTLSEFRDIINNNNFVIHELRADKTNLTVLLSLSKR